MVMVPQFIKLWQAYPVHPLHDNLLAIFVLLCVDMGIKSRFVYCDWAVDFWT